MRRQALGAFLAFAILLMGWVWGTAAAMEVEPRAVLQVPDHSNYLRNSDFSTDMFWILKGDTFLRSDVGRGGGRGVLMQSDKDYDSELVQTIGPQLIPGRTYTVSAWVRSETADAVAVVGVRWEGGHPRVFRGVNPDDGWSKVEFRFTAPQTPGWRQIVLSGTGTLVWDDVSLYEAETVEARLAATWEARMAAGDEVYTGLVINAKGTDLQRGMNPRIFDESGRLVFAGIDASEGQMIAQGIVAYATDLATGTSHPRLEVSDFFPLRVPLVIDAQATAGLPRTAAVISDADAERIRKAVQNYDFLGRFAVVFVVEPLAGF